MHFTYLNGNTFGLNLYSVRYLFTFVSLGEDFITQTQNAIKIKIYFLEGKEPLPKIKS